MAISLTQKPILQPPKLISFVIPNIQRWRLHFDNVDSNGVHLQEWCEGEGKNECRRHHISVEANVIFSMNFLTFCEKITSGIELRYNRKYNFGRPFFDGKYLIKWMKEKNGRITYLFTLILGKTPYFFVLEYETTNINEYNSASSIYLKMLREAKIIDYHPSKT